MSKTNYFDLRIVEPDFGSSLVDSIINLDHLRRRKLGGSTHPKIFFQLKNVFHLLESIGSARIEGNNTTIAEYIETKITPSKNEGESILEIMNMEEAMSFIEEQVDENTKIDRALILELHRYTVKNLTKEGDKSPGQFRKVSVVIKGSLHKPPLAVKIDEYMDELLGFINHEHEPKYDLLKTALSHHRFSWVHPFSNGNGRVVRLLTYAMLIKQGFRVKTGRILNPTAVFCNDRDMYYQMLAQADTGSDEGLLSWCTYVLDGLNEEITKVDKLSSHEYLTDRILLPAIEYCREREQLTKLESDILRIAVKETVFQSSDIAKVLPGKIAQERSRQLSKMRDKKLIAPIAQKARKYTIYFSNNYLLRGVISALQNEGFISPTN